MGRFSTDLPEAVDLFMTTESLLCFMLLTLWLHYYNHKAVGTSTARITINHTLR